MTEPIEQVEQVPAGAEQVIVAGSTVGYILSCGDSPDIFHDAMWDRENPASPQLRSAEDALALLVRPATVTAIDANGKADLEVALDADARLKVAGRSEDDSANTPGTWHRV